METFPDEQLFGIQVSQPWYVDIVNFIVSNQIHDTMSYVQKDRLKNIAKQYI